jgi:hypothetical protein
MEVGDEYYQFGERIGLFRHDVVSGDYVVNLFEELGFVRGEGLQCDFIPILVLDCREEIR